MPTMHRQMESLVKAVELMREGQEDNVDSDDDEDDKQEEDNDTTASGGTLLVTTRTTRDMDEEGPAAYNWDRTMEFEYLLNMPLSYLTTDRIEDL